mgnify:CR=1 FL=1
MVFGLSTHDVAAHRRPGTARSLAPRRDLLDALHLRAGDYLEIELRNGTLVLTPKALVDKQIEERLSEASGDIKNGRIHRPIQSTKELIRSLRRRRKKQRKS